MCLIKNKVRDNNYINIQGWMVTKLGLKGNELIIYAIIFGFSQDNDTIFNGSIAYLMDWTNATKKTVIDTLTKLVEKELIIKEEGNSKTNKYGINNEVIESLFVGNYIAPEQDKKEKDIDIINNIINHLNTVCGRNFKPTEKTKKLIRARLNEKFVEDDFKRVIEFKNSQWKNDATMSQYLRPETLFGTKFEGYLNSAPKFTVSETKTDNIEQEMSDEEWLEMMENSYNEI